jgi:hypothetical protein
MRHGFRIHLALSEFATAALLITVAAYGVSYFYTKRMVEQHAAEAAACATREPVIVNHYITVPAPKVHVRVVVPPPTVIEPQTTPESLKEQPKVWDNDNLPSASAPPVFKAQNR